MCVGVHAYMCKPILAIGEAAYIQDKDGDMIVIFFLSQCWFLQYKSLFLPANLALLTTWADQIYSDCGISNSL